MAASRKTGCQAPGPAREGQGGAVVGAPALGAHRQRLPRIDQLVGAYGLYPPFRLPRQSPDVKESPGYAVILKVIIRYMAESLLGSDIDSETILNNFIWLVNVDFLQLHDCSPSVA